MIFIIIQILLVLLLLYLICENILKSDKKIIELQSMITLIDKEFKYIPIYKSSTKSYTINKSKIYLRLTDRNDEYYSNNTLIYVLLHEISHILCDDIGHTESFHTIFSDLLLQAETVGIYDPYIPISYYDGKHN